MSRLNIFAQVVLSLYFVSISLAETRAALLAEVGINVSGFDGSPPASDSLLYRFAVLSLSPPTVVGEWGRQVTVVDVGTTFEAPAEIVRSFVEPLSRPHVEVGIGLHRSAYGSYLDQLQAGAWAECCDIVTFRKFVPDITNIPVNRLTMTIESFYFERFGRYANYAGAHTIRIYGVPEPSTLILFSVGLLLSHRRARH